MASRETRSKARKSNFERIFGEVVKTNSAKIKECFLFNDIGSMHDLLTLKDEDINNLQYEVNDRIVKLPLGPLNTIRIVRAWHEHLQDMLNIRNVDWGDEDTVSQENYEKYRNNGYNPRAHVVLPGGVGKNNLHRNNNNPALQQVTRDRTQVT